MSTYDTSSGGIISSYETVFDGDVVEGATVVDPGSLHVESGGVIIDVTVNSQVGVYVSNGGVASNTFVSGTVTDNDTQKSYLFISSGGTAYNVSATDNSEVDVDSGGYLSGAQIGGAAVNNTGSSYGASIDVFDSIVSNTTVSSGGVINVAGGAAYETQVIDGKFVLSESGSVFNTTLSGSLGDYESENGSLFNTTVEGGALLLLEQNANANGVSIDSGSVLMANGATASNIHISSGGTLEFFGSNVSDVTVEQGGIIGFEGLSYNDGYEVTFSDNVLSVYYEYGASSSVVLSGDYNKEHFVLSGDESNTFATLEEGTPCYCLGTLIETDRGEVPVENLAIGDLVRTRGNGLRPVRWIGRRAYSGRFAADNLDVLPIVLRAGALGDSLPRQDLFVSPLHAMFIDGVLVPASGLVNDTTIVQAKTMDEVSYFHIELDTHDVIFANGAESETFVDDESRFMFHNAAEYAQLYPDARREPARYCAPRVEGGAQLEAIRARLARPSRTIAADPAPLTGYLDTVSHTRLAGWALNPKSGHPVRLQVLDRGVVIGEVVADRPRPDLRTACGFVFIIPGGLSTTERHLLEVRRAEDHAGLRNSPWMLDAEARAPRHAIVTPTSPTRPLVGHVDLVSRERLTGWVFSPAEPTQSVRLQLVVNGQCIASVVANMPRPDVPAADACPRVRCGFDILLAVPLAPFSRHVVELRREQDGARLGGSHIIEPVDACDPDFERAVRQVVASVDGEARQNQVLSFLLGQVETLAQARADRDSGQPARDMQRAKARRGLAAPPGRRQRALVIDSRHPDPQRDAGSVALLSHIRTLQELGYEISFAGAEDMGHRPATVQGIGVLSAPTYHSIEEVLRRQADSFDLVYLHRCDNAVRYTALARMHQRRARIIYSIADLHFLRLQRQAAVEQRPELLTMAARQRRMEYRAMLEADLVLTHSTAEAETIRRELPGAHVHVAPWVVPLRKRRSDFAERSGVLFLGNYGHAPNADAARWLVADIMPRVWAQDPSIRCILAGAEMPGDIRRLAGERVEVAGAVADLDALLDRVRVSVAPLRFGAGIKGKVLESFAAGVPCVMSDVAAEGLDLPARLQELVASQDAEALARQIVRQHSRSSVNGRLGHAARAYLRDHWSAAAVHAALSAMLTARQDMRQSG